MSKVDVVLGIQWGDEGKGKIVDAISTKYKVVARFQGGPNAGHTIVIAGQKAVIRTIPSGIFRDGVTNVIGNGVVVDPVLLQEEIEQLESLGLNVKSNLVISRKANLILPTHRDLDAASEASKGPNKIGTTLKGISPAYVDKVGRSGLRFGDIYTPEFKAKYEALKKTHLDRLEVFKFPPSSAEYETKWFAAIEKLKAIKVISEELVLNKQLQEGIPILAEGAQGSLLDITFGTYPFVTSSNTLTSGVCTGLGIAPNKIGEVLGIFKAYTTRVGGGQFPTELFDDVGEKICQIGKEFGAVTGRKRRCGWLDLVGLKYAIMLNGCTSLVMMKADVLDDFDPVKICVAYEVNGERTEDFPYEITPNVKPIYQEFPGWKSDIRSIKKYEDLPPQLIAYIELIEKVSGIPVKIISVGPDRDETIIR